MKTNDVHYALRGEAAAAFLASLIAFALAGGSWPWFGILFFVPDLSILGYRGGNRWGAAAYNAVHSYALPLFLATLTCAWTWSAPSPLWLVWFAHIAFDRALGYGLKFDAGFQYTHLGTMKTQKAPAEVR